MNRVSQWTMGMMVIGLLSGEALAEPVKAEKRTVSVQGTGKFVAVPDIATLRVEVNAEGKTVADTTAEVRKKMQAVLASIKQAGIAEKDVQTQQYTIQPRYDYSGGKSKRTGYYVSNQVAVTVRDLSKTGILLSAVTDAGANQVVGPEFSFDNPKQYERKALANAVDDAKAKAKILADSTGATLGEVQTISEGGISWPGPQPRVMAMARMQSLSAESAPEPIAAGEQPLTASVSITYLLK